jgi:hypothetical protein
VLGLNQVLETFRLSGRKIFLATNSLYDYTHVVMNYLLGGRTGQHRTEDWMRYFDVVITGVGQFLSRGYAKSFFVVLNGMFLGLSFQLVSLHCG